MDATMGVLHKRGLNEVLSTPGKKSSSPARRQTKKQSKKVKMLHQIVLLL